MKGKVYINGDLLPADEASISVYDRGFQYGDGIFEGLRCYNGKIFKLKEHVQRLFQSAKAIQMRIPLSHDEMCEAIKTTVRANAILNAHIKPIVTRGYGWKLGLDPHNTTEANIVIIVREIGESMYAQADKGLRLAVVSLRKPPPYCLDPRVKSLNYLLNILARAEAQASGADEALLLDTQGYLAEGSADNIFLVREKMVYTPTLQSALAGITRQTVIDMAVASSIKVFEQSLTQYDLYNADEAFVTGSGAGIASVVQVDGRPVGDGKPGPITQKLIQLYTEVVKEGEPV